MLHHNEYEDFENPILTPTFFDDVASHLGYERKKKYSFSWFLLPLILLLLVLILSKKKKEHSYDLFFSNSTRILSLFAEYSLLQPILNTSCKLSQSTACHTTFISYELHRPEIESPLGLSCSTVISSDFKDFEYVLNHALSRSNLSFSQSVITTFVADEDSEPTISDLIIIN